MKPKHFFLLVFVIAFLFDMGKPVAQVRLPQLIGDSMVLQRDIKLQLWGWASPGETVKINFNRHNYHTKAAADGKWSLSVPAMKAGGPYEMKIDASNHIIIHDILIGDVWFCSGQSNMVLPMERVKEKYPEEIANANYPQIRNFFVPTVSDVTKLHDDLPPGKWLEANPKNVLTFGAASYFFAKKIYEKYHVPIGLINSSVGGTPIQAWISAEGIQVIPKYAARLKELQDSAYYNSILRRDAARHKIDAKRPEVPDAGLTGPKKWYDTSYVAEGWHKFWLPGYWDDQGVHNLNGVVWFRKQIDVPAAMCGKPVKLFLGRIVDADQAYVNGTFVGNITYQYPPRRYTIPAGVLRPGKNLIVVRIRNDAGKGGFVPDKPYYMTDGEQKIDLRGDWQYKVGAVFPPRGRGDFYAYFSAQNEPTGLYNPMVAPAIDYKIKGFLWYQGEANTGSPKEYGQLLPALISDWRNKWGEGNLPFIYAQLPGFMDVSYSPEESKWAELRESQLKTLSVPNTAMAVTIDAGEWNDIHPLDKKDVGDWLALGAEKIAYGDASVVSSGPVYQSAQVVDNKIVLTFSDTGSGLMAKGGGELNGFAISDGDGHYVWAKAQIVGNKVEVWSDAVPHPKYVRYAWADNPEGANLFNKEDLPASPFTTDLR